MALPAGILGNCTVCIELSTDGTTWVDFSDYLSILDPEAMTRINGQAHVFGEDTAIIHNSKREPFNVTIRGVYADATATTNPFRFVWAQWTTTCGGAMCIRYAPAGCATANQVFSTATATAFYSELIGVTPPAGDAASGDPLMWEAVVRAPELFLATYA